MKSVWLKFASAIIVAWLAFIFAPRLMVRQGWIATVPSFAIEVTSVLTLLTVTLFFYLQKIQQTKPQKFAQVYLLSITVKMVVGCTLVLIIIFLDRAGSIANALLFIVSYFVLTAIEIFFLLKGRNRA